VHVQRKLQWLKRMEVECEFYDLRDFSITGMIAAVLRHRVVHCDSSSPFMHLVVAIICKATRRKHIMTYHGNLGRWDWFRNKCENLAIRLSDAPLVLNRHSLGIAGTLNRRSRLLSAFIPPLDGEDLDGDIRSKLDDRSTGKSLFFCANAFRLSRDKTGAEIYGIIPLVEIFRRHADRLLIVSDPSGTYSEHYASNNEEMPENVVLISRAHSFFELLKRCDHLIRPTTTDGDSISIREALYLGVGVIASDCVDRPAGVITHRTGDWRDLEEKILSAGAENRPAPVRDNPVHAIVELYQQFLDRPAVKAVTNR